MGWLGTLRSIGNATGRWGRDLDPAGCTLGKVIYREAKRSAQIVNVRRPTTPLPDSVQGRLAPEFPDLDLGDVRIRTRCRLPANRFDRTGSVYAMTFGNTIYWRGDVDFETPRDLARLVHELVHVDQVRRLGGEAAFACAYGVGFVDGDGDVPPTIRNPTAYHRNPLEAEAYTIEAAFRAAHGG